MSLLSNGNSILYKSFDDESMKNIGPRHNEALRLDCQLMLKKNNTHDLIWFIWWQEHERHKTKTQWSSQIRLPIDVEGE